MRTDYCLWNIGTEHLWLQADLSSPPEFHAGTAKSCRNKPSMRGLHLWCFFKLIGPPALDNATNVSANPQPEVCVDTVSKQVFISGQGATTDLATPRYTLHASCCIFISRNGGTSWWSSWVTPLPITPWMLFWSPATSGMLLWDPWASWGSQCLFYKGGSHVPNAKLTKLSSEVAQSM